MTNAPHPWAILDGERPLFHTPGSYLPKFEINDELETLWRAKQKKREIRQLNFFDNYVLSHQEAENA